MFVAVLRSFGCDKDKHEQFSWAKLALSFIPKHLECGKSSNSLRLSECAFRLRFSFCFNKKKTIQTHFFLLS